MESIAGQPTRPRGLRRLALVGVMLVGLAGCAGDPGPCSGGYGGYMGNPAGYLLIPFWEAGCAILGHSSTAEMTPEERFEWQAAYDAAVAAGEENPEFALIRREREEQYCLHGQVEYCDPNTSVALAAGAGALAGSNSPSGKGHDPTQSQATGPITVGILPPAFLSPTSPSNDGRELVIYGEIRRYIHSNPNFALSYDYGARYGAGLLDTHAGWQGPVVKKVPNKAKMWAIGEELDVDVLVLAWITNNMANPIDLYVFKVASGEMRRSSANLHQAKQLVESTFAQSGIPR